MTIISHLVRESFPNVNETSLDERIGDRRDCLYRISLGILSIKNTYTWQDRSQGALMRLGPPLKGTFAYRAVRQRRFRVRKSAFSLGWATPLKKVGPSSSKIARYGYDTWDTECRASFARDLNIQRQTDENSSKDHPRTKTYDVVFMRALVTKNASPLSPTP